MPETIGPYTHHELRDVRAEAEKHQFKRGSAGVWARRALRLLATIEQMRLRVASLELTIESIPTQEREGIYDDAEAHEQPH